MKPCLKRGHHFCVWNVDLSIYQNNRTRYSWKTEAKVGKLPCKETKLRETQATQSTRLGQADERSFFALLFTVPLNKKATKFSLVINKM